MKNYKWNKFIIEYDIYENQLNQIKINNKLKIAKNKIIILLTF